MTISTVVNPFCVFLTALPKCYFFYNWWALEGAGILTYGNDNENTFRVSMVESKSEFLHRVINTGKFSEVFRSSSLTPFLTWYFQLGHL